MSKLLRLFEQIEQFCARATRALILTKQAQQTYVSPEDIGDTGMYEDIMQAARQVSDESLSSELQLVAEMYKRALELGGGYSSINRAISNLINLYMEDEDNEENMSVEDLLNNVVKDLRTRAGGLANLNKPDSPEIMAQLKKFRDDYNSRQVEDEIDDLSRYDEKAVSTFDPTGGMGRDEAQKGSGRGYMVRTMRSPKDWAEHYRSERQRYTEEFGQSTARALGPKFQSIINVLAQLIEKMSQFSQLQKEVVDDPDKRHELEALADEIKKLRDERRRIKTSLRNEMLKNQQEKLQVQFKGAGNERERFLIQQELELNKVLASPDKNKGEEIKLRRLLLNSMKGGNTLGAETKNKLMEKIKEAEAKKVPIEKVRKEEATKIRGKKEGKSLEGLIIDLRQKIATQKIVIKQIITDKWKKEEHTKFRPYLDAIAIAKTNNDAEGVKSAIKQLQTAMNNDAEEHPSVQEYVEKIKNFYDVRDTASIIEKSKIMESDAIIPEHIRELMKNVIVEAHKLVGSFDQTEHFKTIVTATRAIADALEKRLYQSEQQIKHAAEKIPISQRRKEEAARIREKKESKSLEGLIINLSQTIATTKGTIKAKITDKLTLEQNELLKPYLDAITIAKTNNDAEGVKSAIKELRNVMNIYAEGNPDVRTYTEMADILYKFRDKSKMIDDSKFMNTSEPIQDNIKNLVVSTIEEGEELSRLFAKIKHFGNIVAAINVIVSVLKERLFR